MPGRFNDDFGKGLVDGQFDDHGFANLIPTGCRDAGEPPGITKQRLPSTDRHFRIRQTNLLAAHRQIPLVR